MSELISHTPTWVFALFFILLILGFIQSKKRVVKVKTVFILPFSMITLSIFGVLSVFGMYSLAIGFWIIGFIFTLFIGVKLAYPKQVTFSKNNNNLTIPGSWIPLLLMMGIFFTKYFVGFAVARGLPFINELAFILFISFLYGVFSGIFLSRSLIMFQSTK